MEFTKVQCLEYGCSLIIADGDPNVAKRQIRQHMLTSHNLAIVPTGAEVEGNTTGSANADIEAALA